MIGMTARPSFSSPPTWWQVGHLAHPILHWPEQLTLLSQDIDSRRSIGRIRVKRNIPGWWIDATESRTIPAMRLLPNLISPWKMIVACEASATSFSLYLGSLSCPNISGIDTFWFGHSTCHFLGIRNKKSSASSCSPFALSVSEELGCNSCVTLEGLETSN